MRIALFVTCMNNAIYPRTGRAVVTVQEPEGTTIASALAKLESTDAASERPSRR